MCACISQNMDSEFPQSTEIVTWTNASLLPAKPIIERWWGVIVRWHLHISSHFWGWSMRPVLIGQKSLLNQWTSTLHWNFTEVNHIPIWRVWSCWWKAATWNWRRGGRMHETRETNSDQTTNCSRKEALASAKAAHRVHCFWRLAISSSPSFCVLSALLLKLSVC